MSTSPAGDAKAWEFENHEIKSMEIKKDGDFRDIMVGESATLWPGDSEGKESKRSRELPSQPWLGSELTAILIRGWRWRALQEEHLAAEVEWKWVWF